MMNSENNNSHTYEYPIELAGDSAPARVIRIVGQNKRVLEIGAGPGSITKYLKCKGNCSVIALEIDDDAIVKLSPFCEKVFKADLNDTTWPRLLDNEEKFDAVVIADVLEHLYNPWETLKLIPDMLNDEGYIVVSLPHVGHSAVVSCLLSEDFDYGDWGLLDRTHIRFFGLKNIQSLFNDAGLSIEEAQFVIVSPEASEFSNFWKSLNIETRTVLSTYRHSNIYQVVIKAIPTKRASRNLDLMLLPVDKPRPENAHIQELKQAVKAFLPKKYYANAKTLLRTLGIKRY